ncbi:MAG: hypothetical protein KY455_03335 [Euryarchaeota archaeon]|nr:hypothetical protein [Euryarchaeota archaeon]
MDVTFLGGVNAIGGNKFLLTDGVDKESRVLLDFGMQFGDPKSYMEAAGPVASMGAFYDEFLPPRTNCSLRDLLKLGILPSVDGLYRDDWLVTPGFRKAVKRHLGELPLEDYWTSDLESYHAYKARTGRPFVDAVLLTHAHADHFQHLAFLDPEIPVYCTAVTRSIVKAAGDVSNQRDTAESYAAVLRGMEEITDKGTFPGAYQARNHTRNGERPRPYHIVTPYEWFPVGAFRAQAIPIDHSVPGACFFLIEGKDGKRALYTGDFRFHGVYEAASDEAKRRLADLRPDALLCEGTRIDSDHQDSEHDVLHSTTSSIQETDGLILAEWGWKDLTRFLTMREAAMANDRILLVDPRVAYTIDRVAKVDPTFRPFDEYDSVAVYLRRKDTMTYSPADYKKHELGCEAEWDKEVRADLRRWWLGEDGAPPPRQAAHFVNGVPAFKVRQNPSRYVVQTSYFQMSELFDLDPPKGSRYIRSSCEPFNDEMISDTRKLTNWLSVWDIASDISRDSGHHTSGHASGAELARFWDIVKPKTLFPVHTQQATRFGELWGGGDVRPPKLGETVTV